MNYKVKGTMGKGKGSGTDKKEESLACLSFEIFLIYLSNKHVFILPLKKKNSWRGSLASMTEGMKKLEESVKSTLFFSQ